MNALPLSYTASNYTVVRKNLLWKRFLSEFRRKLPFGFEPKTCWFVINCSIQLSYDSMCAGRNRQTRTNEREFHIARTCANVRIADTGVEPVISCLGGKRGYPFHSSAIAVCRICTHKPKLKAYYWLQSVPKSIDTQHTACDCQHLRKDTELSFTKCQRMESNHFLSAFLSRAPDRSFQWATMA